MSWHAALELGFSASHSVSAGDARRTPHAVRPTGADATWLSRRAHHGPLLVQRPFFPEGPAVCHVYVLHPPGGMVGGDELRLDLEIDAGAHALVTTPAAGKVYRSKGSTARQLQTFDVQPGGALEWLPQEIILHDGALAALETRVSLGAGARFIGAETLCFGLPARDEMFARGSCRHLFELRRDGRPLCIERGRFDGGGRVHRARWGLGGATVLALLVASPAPTGELLPALRAQAAEQGGDGLAGVTVLDGALVCRYMGPSAERARAVVQGWWRLLRPALLGREAVPPRIWAT